MVISNRRGDRAVEGARLESVCTVTPYRGFESLPLRQFFILEKFLLNFLWFQRRPKTPVFMGFREFELCNTCVLRESQNHQFYPKISLFVLQFSVTCERWCQRWTSTKTLILLCFLDLSVLRFVFNVSWATAYRDIDELVKMSLLCRVSQVKAEYYAPL